MALILLVSHPSPAAARLMPGQSDTQLSSAVQGRRLLESSIEKKIHDAFNDFGKDIQTAAQKLGSSLDSGDVAEDAEEAGEDVAEVGEDLLDAGRRRLLESSIEKKIHDAFSDFGKDIQTAAKKLGSSLDSGDVAEDAEEAGEDVAEVGEDLLDAGRRRLLESSIEKKIHDAFNDFGKDIQTAAKKLGSSLDSGDVAEDAEEAGEDVAEVGEDVAEAL